MMRRELFLDARNGGFGDVWMRLAGLHAAAALRPELRIRAVFAPEIAPLARVAFAGRIEFVDLGPDGEPPASALVYTNRGLRDLLPGLRRGRRYVAPLHRVVASLSRRRGPRDRINALLFSLLDAAGRVSIAPEADTESYCGRLETSAVPALRAIPAEALLHQIAADFPEARERLRNMPLSGEGGEGLLVFPSGKGHQYMPAAWAARYLPEARYAFHAADGDAAAFEAMGLATVRFARPEEILALARGRRRVLTTDSFPSHLLQYGCEAGRLGILLTRTRPASVVTPGFLAGGTVFPSSARCLPCPHRERGTFRLCAEGFPSCIAWDDAERNDRIVAFARG